MIKPPEAEAAERRASALARPVVLRDVRPGGESLNEFIRRAIVTNPEFADAAASCRRLNPSIDVKLPAIFVPGLLSARLMAEVHAALTAFYGDLAQPRNAEMLDAFLVGKFPLALRMALAENPVLDTAYENEQEPNPVFHERLSLSRIAAQRRDSLIMQLLERLRSGTYVARGFLAGDAARNEIPVPAGWWNDKAVQCLWRENELGPSEAAPDGTPHYRGLKIYVAGEKEPAPQNGCPAQGSVAASTDLSSDVAGRLGAQPSAPPKGNRSPGTVPPRKRGPRGQKTNRIKELLLSDLRSGKRDVEALIHEKTELWAESLGVSRDTLKKAIERAVSEFETPTNPDK